MSETKSRYTLGSPVPFSDMGSTLGPHYAQEWNDEPTELDNDLEEGILSTINELKNGHRAFLDDDMSCVATAIENAYYRLQWLMDDYFVERVRNDN